MNKKLAIIGHKTRGKEIINILKMLGGKRGEGLAGDELFSWYYINSNGCIDYKHYSLFDGDTMMLTLEQFLEKYPYKIGDKVNFIKYNKDYPGKYVINDMRWDGSAVEYAISKTDLLGMHGIPCFAKDLKPYEKPNNNMNTDFIIKETDTDGKVEVVIPDDFEYVIENNKLYFTKKKPIYPKTYEECCEVIGDCADCSLTCFACNLLNNLQQLLVCRDAYWEIADWTPDWNNDNQMKYIIVNRRNNIIKDSYTAKNAILAFPTEEMRDLFYENFKELIEKCKELW